LRQKIPLHGVFPVLLWQSIACFGSSSCLGQMLP
jgi:hypothetical protein